MNYSRFEKHLEKLSSKINIDSGYDYHESIIDTLFEVGVKRGSFKKVLDVGIGVGYELNKFKESGIKATGITLSKEEFEKAKALGHDVHLMDMAFLDFEDEVFDLVWCRHALEHSVMPVIALMEFHRVLKNNGVLYVEIPNDNSFQIFNENHFSLFSDFTWQELFKKTGFAKISMSQAQILFGSWIDIYLQYWLRKV